MISAGSSVRATAAALAEAGASVVAVGTLLALGTTAVEFFANRSVVATETRVFANTPAIARRFAIYWRVIHPGSDIIRRMWLRAIRRRAKASQGAR